MNFLPAILVSDIPLDEDKVKMPYWLLCILLAFSPCLELLKNGSELEANKLQTCGTVK